MSAALSLPTVPLTLGNGLRVVMQPDPRVPLVAVELSLGAGAADDPADRRGLAHLCEHLAFSPPPEHPAARLAALLRRRGGSTNAVTSHDQTRFTALLPAASLPLALRLEGRRLARPAAAVSSEGLETQRHILLQEHHQRRGGRSRGGALELLQGLLYPEPHPYGRPAEGSPAGVAAATTDDARSFLEAHYRADNAVLALVGDLEPEEVARWLERHLAPLPAAPASARRQTPAAAADGPRQLRLEGDAPVPHTYLACSAPGYGEPGWYAACLLLTALAVGRSSPLRRRLVEETGVARAVGASMITLRRASTLVLSASAAPGVGAERLEEALAAAVEDLLEGGPPPEAWRRARRKILTDFYFGIQRLDHRARLCARLSAFFGAPERLREEERRATEIDGEELERHARRLFRPEGRAVLTFTAGGGR